MPLHVSTSVKGTLYTKNSQEKVKLQKEGRATSTASSYTRAMAVSSPLHAPQFPSFSMPISGIQELSNIQPVSLALVPLIIDSQNSIIDGRPFSTFSFFWTAWNCSHRFHNQHNISVTSFNPQIAPALEAMFLLAFLSKNK